MRTDKNQQNPNSIFWAIWASILSGICILQFIIGGGIPEGTNQADPPTAIFATCIVLIAASTIIRWILIPKTTERGKLLVLTIMGLALADGAQIFQLFLIGNAYPETQLTLFVLSLLSAVQFVPIFVKTASH